MAKCWKFLSRRKKNLQTRKHLSRISIIWSAKKEMQTPILGRLAAGRDKYDI